MYVGRARGSSASWAGLYRAVPGAGAWRVEARLHQDEFGGDAEHGFLLLDSVGPTKFANIGRYYAGEARHGSYKWDNATTTGSGAPSWATDGSAGGVPDLTDPMWFAIERSSGGALTAQWRTDEGRWNTYGTLANDGAALGLTALAYVGFGINPKHSGASRICRAYLTSWTVS